MELTLRHKFPPNLRNQLLVTDQMQGLEGTSLPLSLPRVPTLLCRYLSPLIPHIKWDILTRPPCGRVTNCFQAFPALRTIGRGWLMVHCPSRVLGNTMKWTSRMLIMVLREIQMKIAGGGIRLARREHHQGFFISTMGITKRSLSQSEITKMGPSIVP